MARNFLDISRQECMNSYNEIVDNSDRHFNVAELISQKEEYGIAISHLILGTEELVKALIIFLDGEGLHIRKVKGVRLFFYRHIIRHSFADIFLVISTVLNLLMPFVNRLKNLIHNENMRESMTEFEAAILTNNKDKVNEISIDWIDKNIKQYVDKFELINAFWTKAEMYKQRGFYVDFNEQLVTPKHMSKVDYIQAFEITKSFCVNCKNIMTFLRLLPNRDKEIIVKFINDDKELYHSLENFVKDKN
jgi:AbiV family abortive infection protein